jgi:hypothetical protein
METLIDQPVVVQPSDLPDSLSLAAAGEPAIVDMTERVRQAYVNWGLLKPGDGFVLSYDRVEVRYQSLVLGPIDPRKGEPIALHRVEYLNETNLDQSIKYAEKKETTVSLSVSMTTGFKYSMTAKGSIALKKILEVGGEKSLEFSLSSTATTSIEVKKEWSWEWPIVVPARSRVIATALISRYYVEPSFTADLEIFVARHPNFDPGYNPLYVAITRGGETTWYRSSLESALNPYLGGGFLPGRDHNHVIFRCAGKLSGVDGRDFIIHLKQSPVGPKGMVQEQIITPGPAETASVVTLAPPAEDDQYAPVRR